MKNLFKTIDLEGRRDRWEDNRKHYIITTIILFFLSIPVIGTILYSLSTNWFSILYVYDSIITPFF